MICDRPVPRRGPHRPHQCLHLLPSPPAPGSPGCSGPQPPRVLAQTGSSAWTVPGHVSLPSGGSLLLQEALPAYLPLPSRSLCVGPQSLYCV